MPEATAGAALEHRPPTAAQLPDRVARGCDWLLDAVLVLMATWTLVYHVSFLLRLSSTVALLVEAAVLATVVAAIRGRHGARSRADEPTGLLDSQVVLDRSLSPTALARAHPGLLWTTVGAAAVATVAMALQLPWVLVWVPWLVAAAAGTSLALRTLVWTPADVAADLPGESSSAADATATVRPSSWLVVALGAAAAVLSLVILRPNPDDLFYVNLSQWVAAHGSFPHRDTIYADLAYPISNWPPLASYDAGVGALARLLGIHAATVAYVAVPPVVAFLSVLAMWRLLRAWRVQHLLVALSAAVLFMMFDGTSSYGSPGNLWVTRLWQGKVILLCVVVPMLLVLALRYVEAPSRRRAGWLAIGGVASIACSTTAAFLIPVVALAAAAPLVRRSPRHAATLFGAMAGYPLAMAILTKAVGGRSADDFGARRQYRFDPAWFGHAVFLDGVIAVVGVGAVLVGCLLVPHPAARVTTAAAAVLTGITYIPGVTHLGYDTVGLGPTLWRLSWSLSVAALVGVAASYAATRLRSRRVSIGAAVVVAALVAGLGHPILAADTATSFALPPHWQRGTEPMVATAWILDNTEPGDRVLAPDGLAITVAVTTTAVKTVTPRDYYMYYLRGEPSFDYDQRLTLTRFVNADPGWDAGQVPAALQSLQVKIACVYRIDHAGTRLLQEAGYRNGLRTTSYHCLTAPDSTTAVHG